MTTAVLAKVKVQKSEIIRGKEPRNHQVMIQRKPPHPLKNLILNLRTMVGTERRAGRVPFANECKKRSYSGREGLETPNGTSFIEGQTLCYRETVEGRTQHMR